MRVVLLLVLAATAAFAAELGAPIACTQNATYEIRETSTTIGCTSYVNSLNVTWILKGSVARVVDFTYLNSETTYDYIEIFYEEKSYGRFSGRTFPDKQLSFGPGDIRVTFRADSQIIWVGFTLIVFPRPTPHPLVSAQPYYAQSSQGGGFVYFGLPALTRGRLYTQHVDITYDGLKPPGCFVFVDGFPTLEHYHYTNATVKVGNIYTCTLSVAKPRDGAWNIGIFLYGNAAKMTVTATWTFELPQLQPSELNKGVTTVREPKMYQISVPVGARTLKFELSREEPGGYPAVYIAQGVLPSPTHYQYMMDSRKSSYLTLSIPAPNPYGSFAPNPGNYIILLVPAEGASAGYLFRAVW